MSKSNVVNGVFKIFHEVREFEHYYFVGIELIRKGGTSMFYSPVGGSYKNRKEAEAEMKFIKENAKRIVLYWWNIAKDERRFEGRGRCNNVQSI